MNGRPVWSGKRQSGGNSDTYDYGYSSGYGGGECDNGGGGGCGGDGGGCGGGGDGGGCDGGGGGD